MKIKNFNKLVLGLVVTFSGAIAAENCPTTGGDPILTCFCRRTTACAPGVPSCPQVVLTCPGLCAAGTPNNASEVCMCPTSFSLDHTVCDIDSTISPCAMPGANLGCKKKQTAQF